MPLHAAPLSRRSFLTQGTAAVVGLSVLHPAFSAERDVNPHQIALLSDTHIPNSPEVEARGTNMTTNLRHVVREITALKTAPSSVLINGDCAYLKGLPEDYANLAACVAPLSEAGLPLHLTMGNHDDRAPLFNALKAQKPERPVLDSKHVTVLEMPYANWFLLDSLTQVNVVTGELGDEQRTWLDAALKTRRDKPAIVIAHHTPQFEPPEEGKVWSGLKDTSAFLELLGRHSQVKAFIFGHSHNWSVTRRDGLHLINLPPVAYVFGEGRPNGWVLANVRKDGIDLELRTIDPSHSLHGEKVNLAWN